MEFDEVLEMLNGMQSTEGIPVVRDAFTRYNDEVTEGANAKISELESQLDEMQRKYQDTAARNYELMRAVTAPAPQNEPGDGDDNNLTAEPTEEDKDINRLFQGGR